jgi:hypothetical protein
MTGSTVVYGSDRSGFLAAADRARRVVRRDDWPRSAGPYQPWPKAAGPTKAKVRIR